MKRKIEKRLVQWRDQPDRKPLILNGARQVGKTYILQQFGRDYFDQVIYVNLEANPATVTFFNETLDPHKIIRLLEASFHETIQPHKTLIILDEIQACERALTSLKYFCEDAPEYAVAAAGSLLGVAVNRERYSFPVGKVESMTLHPLDFEEFLLAHNEQRLISEIRTCYTEMTPMNDGLHHTALEYYRLYLIVGGMPAAILAFQKNNKLLDVPNVQNEIMNAYIADMAKYASHTESVKIRACFQSIPAQLAKENRKFQYKIVQKGGSASLFGPSIEWLNFAGIVLKCQKTEQGFDPISVYSDLSSFKLYFADVGLLVTKSGVSHQAILMDEPNLFLGAVAENYIASQLASQNDTLFYWESAHSAELDFLIQRNNEIFAIEVKKGEHTKSKSLNQFLSQYPKCQAVRFSMKNFGQTDRIRVLPLYAAFCLS